MPPGHSPGPRLTGYYALKRFCYPEGASDRWDRERNAHAQFCPQTAPAAWLKVDAGPFSIFAPSGWEFHQLEGVDSFVGAFIGDGVTLKFDFGEYSNPLKEEKKPAYFVVHKSIGGFRAKVVSPRTPGQGITGVYFRNVGHGTRL